MTTYETIKRYLVSVVNSDASNSIIHSLQRFCGVDGNGKCHNWLWYWYFNCASALVDEAIALFPLVFVFSFPLGKCLWTHILLLYLSGQLVKEVFCLPRPQTVSMSVPVAVLDKRYATESGFPSTHTSASCLPFVVLHRAHQLWNLSNGSYVFCLVLCAVFSGSVAASRLYLGVHSPLDIVGGYGIAATAATLYSWLGADFDFFVYSSRFGPALVALIAVAFSLHYPQPRVWSISCGVASSIVGLWLGFSGALLFCHNYFPRPLHILQYISMFPLLSSTDGQGRSRLQVAVIEEELLARAALAVDPGDVPADSWLVLLFRAVLVLSCSLAALELVKAIAKPLLVALYQLRFCPRCLPAVEDSCGVPVPVHKRYCVDIPFKFLTYGVVGWMVVVASPLLFEYFQLVHR